MRVSRDLPRVKIGLMLGSEADVFGMGSGNEGVESWCLFFVVHRNWTMT